MSEKVAGSFRTGASQLALVVKSIAKPFKSPLDKVHFELRNNNLTPAFIKLQKNFDKIPWTENTQRGLMLLFEECFLQKVKDVYRQKRDGYDGDRYDAMLDLRSFFKLQLRDELETFREEQIARYSNWSEVATAIITMFKIGYFDHLPKHEPITSIFKLPVEILEICDLPFYKMESNCKEQIYQEIALEKAKSAQQLYNLIYGESQGWFDFGFSIADFIYQHGKEMHASDDPYFCQELLEVCKYLTEEDLNALLKFCEHISDIPLVFPPHFERELQNIADKNWKKGREKIANSLNKLIAKHRAES